MATTGNFGFQKFGSGGRISDAGYAFSLSDRDNMDALFWKLFNHDHSAEGQLDSINGPLERPGLTLSTVSGNLPPATDFYYKIAFVDGNGVETAASSASYQRTPDPIPSPQAPVLSTATTGGTLVGGTYQYALAFTQGANTTRAVNVNSVSVGTGTATNTVTVTFPTLHTDADGWKIYRRAPNEAEFFLLATVAAGPASYLDDGSVSPDATKKRPNANNTNSANSVTVSISAIDLPLDSNIKKWKIYRSRQAGTFGSTSLLATVSETQTQGGTNLVTSFVDSGLPLNSGSPRSQTAVPPAIPQIGAGGLSLDARLPAALQPQAVQQFYTNINGALVAQTYNQFYIPNPMLLERIDVFFETGPTGVDGSNYVTIRVKDDSLENEVQHIYNDASTVNEKQAVYTDASGGTFTLTFNGVGPTAAIAFDATAATVEAALEALANITDVFVLGSGTVSDPWIVEFLDPGAQNVVALTIDSTNLTGGTGTVTTQVNGSDGGTFTLTDGTDTTAAIAYSASAATLETRLETDITSIVDVTVTGAGTSADPWVVTFVNPANTDVLNLDADDTLLNGNTTISEAVKGRGNTIVDVDCQTAAQYFSWQSSTTDYAKQQAEDAPVTGNGVDVSDSLAGNDVAAEIDAQNETVAWNVGVLEPARYTFNFAVSDTDAASTFDIQLVDLNGPTTLISDSISANRASFVPAYFLEYDVAGTENLELRVVKTDATTNRVRVDYFEYQAAFPTLYGGQTGTIEVIVTGAPASNGTNAHVNVWY